MSYLVRRGSPKKNQQNTQPYHSMSHYPVTLHPLPLSQLGKSSICWNTGIKMLTWVTAHARQRFLRPISKSPFGWNTGQNCQHGLQLVLVFVPYSHAYCRCMTLEFRAAQQNHVRQRLDKSI